MRRISVVLVLMLALGASLLPNTVAHAAKKVSRDARGDLVTFNVDTQGQGKSSKANGDIVRTRVVHTKGAVVVRTKFRALNRAGKYRADFVRIVTNEKVKRHVIVYAERGNWRGVSGMVKPNGNEVNCNIKHRIMYGKNLVLIKIPRSCLSKPRWVRVGVASQWQKGSTAFVDDALRNGQIRSNIKLSGRIRRG